MNSELVNQRVKSNIIEAMDLITDAKISKLKLDKTAQAIVLQPIDLTIGQYQVDYEGNILTAFSTNLDNLYYKNEKVYLKIPENNINNKKFIEGRVNEKDIDLIDNKLNNEIKEAGPSWDNIYDNLDFKKDNTSFYKLTAGSFTKENLKNQFPNFYTIYDRNNQSEESLKKSDKIFYDYSKTYNKIIFGADFLTSIDLQKKGYGNFGIRLTFLAYKESQELEEENSFQETEIYYDLDLNEFTGKPYSYNTFSPQSTILQVGAGSILKLKKIQLFQKDFKNLENLVKNINGKNYYDFALEDIKIKNIKLQFCEIIDYSKEPYRVVIETPQGTSISSRKGVSLIGNFYFKGNSILNERNCKCDWFVRDSSISFKDIEFYDKDVGNGWKKIINKDGFNKIIVKNEQDNKDIDKYVEYKNTYLLKITYNKNYFISMVTISNNQSKYGKIELKQEGDAATGKEVKLIIESDNKNLYGKWYYNFDSHSIIEILQDKELYQQSIKINDFINYYPQINFICEVYEKLEDNSYNKICVLEKEISRPVTQSELSIQYIGLDNFNYTAEGDMPIENSERIQQLYPKVFWKEGYTTSYNIIWKIDDEIINLERYNDLRNSYQPKNSMLKNLFVDSKGTLNYQIKQKYSKYNTNNTLTLILHTVDNKEFEFQKEIVFTKTGDQGTNGTNFVSAVRPIDNEGNKIAGFVPLVINSNDSKYLYKLKNFIYKDGVEINNDTKNYKITYEWTCSSTKTTFVEAKGEEIEHVATEGAFNIRGYDAEKKDKDTIGISLKNGVLNINDISKEIKNNLIIKCKVDIVNINEEDNKRITLYYNYPVPLLEKKPGINYNKNNIDIQIPSYIKYNNRGLNASFLDDEIFVKIKKENSSNNKDTWIDVSDTLTNSSANKELISIRYDNGKYRIQPANNFNYSFGATYLDIKLENYNIIYPIMMFLDTHGNEAINGWDGTSVFITSKQEDHEHPEPGYILAPQIGAGRKDENGLFTGVVMGDDTTQKQIGLYGYKNGINSFGLKSNGTAYFGQSIETGRIDFDGTLGTIMGGGGGDKESGMTIKMSSYEKVENDPYNRDIYAKNSAVKAIQIANDRFYVDYAGNFNSVTGTIGGWVIKETGIFDPDVSFSEEGPEGLPNINKETDSLMTGNIALISGKRNGKDWALKPKAYINEGVVGGWKISKQGIFSPETRITSTGEISALGKIMLVSKEIEVTDSKNVEKTYIKNGKIPRNTVIIENGEIGGWTVTDGVISSNPKEKDKVAKTILNSRKSLISTQTISIVMPNVKEEGELVGSMGMIEGATTSESGSIIGTRNLGLETNSKDRSIILNSKQASIRLSAQASMFFNANTGQIQFDSKQVQINSPNTTILGTSDKNSSIILRAPNINIAPNGGVINLGSTGSSLTCTIPAANQKGIYARFA